MSPPAALGPVGVSHPAGASQELQEGEKEEGARWQRPTLRQAGWLVADYGPCTKVAETCALIVGELEELLEFYQSWL